MVAWIWQLSKRLTKSNSKIWGWHDWARVWPVTERKLRGNISSVRLWDEKSSKMKSSFPSCFPRKGKWYQTPSLRIKMFLDFWKIFLTRTSRYLSPSEFPFLP